MSTPETQFDYQRSLKNVKSYPFLHKYIPVDRLIVRPQAALIVRAVFKTGITPNHLTFISFFLALIAGFVYAVGKPAWVVAGGCLAMLSDVFDAADGMLARAQGWTSRYRTSLDLFLDRIADFIVLRGVSFGIYRPSRPPLPRHRLAHPRPLLPPSRPLLPRQPLPGPREQRGRRRGQEPGRLPHPRLLLIGRPVGILLGVASMASIGPIVKLISFLRKGKHAAAAPAR